MAARPAVVLVLVNPQDIVNIASAVRIARNFGIERMRLVNPELFDPWRIEGIAHNSAEFVRRIEIVDTLEAALADCVFTAVLSARSRTAKRRTLAPREAAAELAREAAVGPVAFVVGREDSGLTNAELDLGHVQVTIPTDPRSPSLNLAQAVALMAYEWWLAAGATAPPKPPRKTADAATVTQLEDLFTDWRRALWAIDFFKTRRPEAVMRSFREMARSSAYWAGNRYADPAQEPEAAAPLQDLPAPAAARFGLLRDGLRHLPGVGETVRYMGQSWRWAWEYGIGNRKLCWVHVIGDVVSTTFTLSDAEVDRVGRLGRLSADITRAIAEAQRTGPVRWCWLELADRRAIESYLRFARHKASWLAERPAPHRAPRARGRKSEDLDAD